MITSEEKRVSNELSPADCVWIPDLKAEGTVIKQHESPRSVVIQTLKSEGTGGSHEEFLREDLQFHPWMRALKDENQREQERGTQTFPQHLKPAKKTTKNCLFLRTNQRSKVKGLFSTVQSLPLVRVNLLSRHSARDSSVSMAGPAAWLPSSDG